MVASQDEGAAPTYFERERERLVAEIAGSLETLIGNANATNRKLEEQISVGKGFESIAELWGRFSTLMTQAGVPNPESARRAEEGAEDTSAM
ncbi:Dolichyl-diphosphooligosaccharide-protein glycosyltransferase subunit dad1 [Malassezia obtusa]|uniref:DASH complex subunit DAD1 n=1 Tax=Malassezia obtusa TaxID=76774 RepID=A0AAF0IT67_9BASI|nr:Dolichyl-diphosphooligosaccharide-protein glycosyltransferase subunit dad1 [Malassezia obtusa]